MWALPDQDDDYAAAPILELLSRIEDPQFIHAMTSPLDHKARCVASDIQAAKHMKSLPQDSLMYYLPRFHLHFELKPGSSKLHSCDYSGYYVATEEALKRALSSVCPQRPQFTQLPLPLLFDQFIVLVTDNPTLPVKIVIPDAPAAAIRKVAVSGRQQAAFFARSTPSAYIGHHVFTFHPYTGNLDTPVVQSRLYLAALHAACSCALPFPGLGMTGGEYALQLLRQSWKNEPFTVAELDKLKALTAVAANTPALQLMCLDTHSASVSLAFLYAEAPLSSTHDQWLAHNLPEQEQTSVRYAYAQEQQRPGCFPAKCPRRLLTAQEAHEVMAMESSSRKQKFGQHLVIIPEVVQWRDLQKQKNWLAVQSFWGDVLKHSKLQQLADELASTAVTHDAPDGERDNLIDELRPYLQKLGNSTHANLVTKQCSDSLAAYKECSATPRLLQGRKVRVGLEQLREKIQQGLGCLGDFLLEAIAFCPERGKHGTALKLYQASALAALPALADLVRVTVQEGFLHVRSLSPSLLPPSCFFDCTEAPGGATSSCTH